MKTVKHLVQGPFDISQAIREIAAAVDELQATVKEPAKEPSKKPATKKPVKKAEEEEAK